MAEAQLGPSPSASLETATKAYVDSKTSFLNPQITSTATAAGTTTLTSTSNQVQVFTGTTTQTVTLPTTSVTAGQQWEVMNQSTSAVTVNASGGATVIILAGGTSAVFTAAINTPVNATDWDCQYGGVIMTTGKSLKVQSSLTLAGVDGASVMLGGATGASVATSEATSSTTYTDLTTTTDQVTVTIGASGMAQVIMYSTANYVSGTNPNFWTSFTMSGANTQSASDAYSTHGVYAYIDNVGIGAPFFLSGLNSGSTTFKMKYRVNTGSISFSNRRIAVIPL